MKWKKSKGKNISFIMKWNYFRSSEVAQSRSLVTDNERGGKFKFRIKITVLAYFKFN